MSYCGSALEVVFHDYALYKSTFTLLYFNRRVMCAQLTRDLFAIAKLLYRWVPKTSCF